VNDAEIRADAPGKTVCLISLGCPKNDVDSEYLWGVLQARGMRLVDSAEQADVVCINTCGFIEDAKQESINAILQAVELKKNSPAKKVYVWGCLSQRYKTQLEKEIPQVDGYFGVEAFSQMEQALCNSSGTKPGRPERIYTPPHVAYLKIADGCSHRCTFCAIPLIKGPMRSVPLEQAVGEAEQLAGQGVKELILVGQDTTAYGEDLGRRENLAALIRALVPVPGIEWIRIMYTHPARVTEELADIIAAEPKVCNYLDIPLQHIATSVLKGMGRGMDSRQTRDVIAMLRNRVPGIVLRTAFITGFPGETEEDFRELVSFVESMRFERMGCFVYSPEEDTPAFTMPGQVEKSVAGQRARELMEMQMEISGEINSSLEGRTLEVIIDGFDKEQNMFFGRTRGDCPEIDQTVWINYDPAVKRGDILNAVIQEGYAYDLFASV